MGRGPHLIYRVPCTVIYGRRLRAVKWRIRPNLDQDLADMVPVGSDWRAIVGRKIGFDKGCFRPSD